MKIKKNSIWFGLLAFFCASCSNYLDIKPYGRTIPKTAEEFSALIHTHLNTIDAGSDRCMVGNATQIALWDAACGDDFETCLTASQGSSLGVYAGDMAFASSESFYSSLYEIIRDCNIVLGEMEENGTAASDEIRAVAYAMRGVAYYQLLRMFCEDPRTGEFRNQLGVPLVVTFDMEEKPLRSTMQETIDRIENDLNHSVAYHLKEPIYRFTEDVVKGYLARLYFWTHQWSQALQLSQELLQKYPLLEGEAYKSMITNFGTLAGNQLLKSYLAASSSGDETLTAVNTAMQYRPVSLRFLSAFSDEEKGTDIRYDMCVNASRQAVKTIFCGMRVAEFKLMEAECYYHLDQTSQALQSINELRAHRISNYVYLTADNLPSLPEQEIITTDAEGNALTPLIALILQERRKELFMEGDRFFEQKRNGAPKYATFYNGLKYTTEKYMYTFPIPYQDIELVEGLEQNPGYVNVE